MAALSSRLTISLLDRVSGPARGISGALGRLRAASRNSFGANFGQQAAQGVTLLHGRLIAATVAAYGLSRALRGAVNPAAAFETKLLDIAQKADLSDAGMAAMGGRIRTLGKDVGRGAGDVASGVDVLMGMGMDADGAMSIMPSIMKGATAYGAEVGDLAKAGMATMTSLNVKASEFSAALDAMAYAGKAGAFELKEMARYLPSLAAQAGGLKMGGLHGVSEVSSALQAVRKNSGTSEEAATHLSDVFGKLTSDETAKKFKKLGVKDIAGDLRKAQAAAIKAKKPFSAVDFLVEKLNKALKGDSGRVGEIFSDKEGKAGATALMQHYKDFVKDREAALKANGTVEKDFARRMLTYEAQIKRFKGAVEDLGISIGNKLLPSLTSLASHFSGRFNNLDKSVNIFDRMKVAAQGFLSAFGSTGFAEMFTKLDNLVFGDPAKLGEDADRLGQIFVQFREWGVWTRDLASSIGDFIGRMAGLAGIDTGMLGTIASYGLKFALAAAGFTLTAIALRKIGSALLFLTGMKAALSVLRFVARLPAVLRGGVPAPSTAPAAPTPPKIGTVTTPRAMTPAEIAAARNGLGTGGVLGKVAGRLKGGLLGAAVETIGKGLIEGALDVVDKQFGLDTSKREDPGFMPTLRRLMGRSAGSNLDAGQEERSRRVDQQFRRDPEAARGRALSQLGRGEGASEVTIAGQSIAQLLQPRGTQDVKVTNPPQIHAPISVHITATTNASAAEIGSQVGAAVKRAVQGTYTDGGT